MELYQIEVEGKLKESWSNWFGGMNLTIKVERGVTTLTGEVADQAALRGILSRIWDLNLSLISVARIETIKEEG